MAFFVALCGIGVFSEFVVAQACFLSAGIPSVLSAVQFGWKFRRRSITSVKCLLLHIRTSFLGKSRETLSG